MRILQRRIGQEVTVLVHGTEAYENAVKASEVLFGKSTTEDLLTLDEQIFLDVFEGVPQADISSADLQEGLDIVLAFNEKTGFLKSNGEVRRALAENSISVNKNKLSEGYKITNQDLIAESYVFLQRGKKQYFILKVK